MSLAGRPALHPRAIPAPGSCFRLAWLFAILLGAILLAGCAGDPVQSAMHPASLPAARISRLSWLLIFVMTAVFLVTMSLLALALLRRARSPQEGPPLGGIRFVIVSGLVIPAFILFGLLLVTLDTTVALTTPEEALTVRVVGHQFWWEVHYPEQNITLANEIQIPTGQPVKLELTSGDVIHSFWVPRLNGKMDLIPGNINTFWIAADRPGAYRGQCAEYCGAQHAKMAFFVVALPPEQFRAWVAARRRADTVPRAPRLREGLQAFIRAGCGTCHTIHGTRAEGKIGPDLTHMGSRLTIGAGTLPNTYGNLQGWIANPQAIKPGNLMPRMYVPSEDLHTIAAYLESLK